MDAASPTQIFISYRRDDTDAVAENIYHHLVKAFGEVVFKDNMRIGPSDAWDREILAHLSEARVVLALIGKDWFCQDEDGNRRIDAEDDWVRKEIEHSLQAGKKLIPLLIDGARRPTERSFNHPNVSLLREKFPYVQDVAIRSRELDKDLHQLIHERLPELGISPQLNPVAGERPVDILADYPLPGKPQAENLPPPYVGIAPFSPREAFLFFGRDQDILALIKKLESPDAAKRIILYHGRSGVGKSSLLSSGLYPRLKKDWEMPPPRRRNREKGLAQDLLDLMKEYPGGFLKRLFVLDQVEEMFSNPHAEPEQEIRDFQEALYRFHQECKDARLLLSFRSDFFTQVRELLTKYQTGIPYAEMELFPLTRAGLREAITGVAEKPELKALYQVQFDPPSLPDDILEDIFKDRHSSQTTALLQYQLKQLFELAAPGWEQQRQPIRISQELYSPEFRKNSLYDMLEAEFGRVRAHWEAYFQHGLLLDVLSQYLTPQITAGSCTNARMLGLYAHIEDFAGFLDFLKNKTSLLIGYGAEHGGEAFARLAHDALAPVLRQRIEESDTLAQRARRIFEGKKSFSEVGKPAISPIRDPEDIRILAAARPYMRAWDQDEQRAFDEGLAFVQQQEAELRDKRTFMFESFANLGKELIYTLDHEKALNKLEVAVGGDADLETKRQALALSLEELLYFFAEAGRRPHLARKAAELLMQLATGPELQELLAKCLREAWQQRTEFAPLLQALSSFQTLQARYYPEMIALKGGSFLMGSPEDDPEHQSDETQHEVSLSSFKIAATPVTFYQYALYGEAEGKSLVNRTPSWGRFGDHPMVYVTWYDVIDYCNWLSRHLGFAPCYTMVKEVGSDPDNEVSNDYLKYKVTRIKGAKGFRLPTEAEWEFAARGGLRQQDFRYAGSNDLHEAGWFWENSGNEPLSGTWDSSLIMENNGRTHPVKEKCDNGIGLYEMSGNVWEWCWDWYQEAYYAESEKKNPQGPKSSTSGRVLRGGSWYDTTVSCRVAYRIRNAPVDRLINVGFRPSQD